MVAVEALQGGRGHEVIHSTRSDAIAEQVIGWYAMRYSIEVMNHNSKRHRGFEQPQGWTRQAVERTAPLAMLLYILIVPWFAGEGHRRWRPLICPDAPRKRNHPSLTCPTRSAVSASDNRL